MSDAEGEGMLLRLCSSHPLPVLPAAPPTPVRLRLVPRGGGVGGLRRGPALLLLKAAPSHQNTSLGASPLLGRETGRSGETS